MYISRHYHLHKSIKNQMISFQKKMVEQHGENLDRLFKEQLDV